MKSYDIHLIHAVNLKNADGETVAVTRIETPAYRPVGLSGFVECVPTNLHGIRRIVQTSRKHVPGWYEPLAGNVKLTIPVANIAIIDEYQD